MPRLPEHQEGREPPIEEKDDVLDILANPFERGDKAFTRITHRLTILGYYKDGFYSVKFDDGLWSDTRELILIHYTDLSRTRSPSAEDGQRPGR